MKGANNMISIIEYPSLIKESYRIGLFGLMFKVYHLKYVKIPFRNFYINQHRKIKRRNQLRRCNRYD